MLYIAHRGFAAKDHPENSLKAVEFCLGVQALDSIELDIRLDNTTGELVTAHDAQFPLKPGDSLEEILLLVDGKKMVMLDIKEEQVVDPLLKLIDELVSTTNWKYHDFVFASYRHDLIPKFHEKNKSLISAAIIDCTPVNTNFLTDVGACIVVINWKTRSDKFISQLKKLRFTVFVFGLEYEEELVLAKNLEVDGVITDTLLKIF